MILWTENSAEALRFCRDDEQLHDLQREGLRILQKKQGFRFGTDAVLLADFFKTRPRERLADFGTGTGVIALLLYARNKSLRIEAIENQAAMADMAKRSVELNGLEAHICVHHADVRDAQIQFGYEALDAVVANPPYTRMQGGMESPLMTRALSRHEKACGLDEFVSAASRVLRNGGRLGVVFPAYRFLELCDAMRKVHIEPKRIRFVHATAQKTPKLVLVEGTKNAKPMLHMEPPLILYDEAGAMSVDLRRAYGEEDAK